VIPEICPNCGAEVPPNAKACPECGSDETTGWSETAYEGGLGLPDEEFDHDKFIEKEFGEEKTKPWNISWFWWAIGVVVIVLVSITLLWGIIRR
jgi:hypothetical protein